MMKEVGDEQIALDVVTSGFSGRCTKERREYSVVLPSVFGTYDGKNAVIREACGS